MIVVVVAFMGKIVLLFSHEKIEGGHKRYKYSKQELNYCLLCVIYHEKHYL